MAVIASTIGCCQENFCLQNRHLNFNNKAEKIGIMSRRNRGLAQESQKERGRMIDCLATTRAAKTFTKLPTPAPIIKLSIQNMVLL